MGMESVYKLSVILNLVDNLSGQMGEVGEPAQIRFWNHAEGRGGNGRDRGRHHRTLHEDRHIHL